MTKMISIWHFVAGNSKKQIIPTVVMKVLASAIVLLTIDLPGLAQTQNWQLDDGSPPEISVTGTSTLHDWKVTSAGITEVPETLSITDGKAIEGFGFKIPVDSLDGGRGATMNTKIQTAFKSSENPFINYTQTAPAVLSKAPGSGDFDITSKGILSLAGKETPITVLVKGTFKDGLITLKGSKELKITDFEMEPPSAMFGQIKTHDDIVVHFEFQYKLKGNE